MDSIVTFIQNHPLIPIFLTLGLGFMLGKLRIKSFALGSVAATLIVGVIIGQLNIQIPDILKTVFFLFFLFSIGYSVGPQFFHSFKGSGIRQALFAVVEALICAAVVIGAAKLMGYNEGIGAGLFAGSQTVSASLGLLGDTVREMPLNQTRREYLLMIIPACYAVTYLLGTIGSAWYLSVIGPKLLGGLDKVKADVARIEQDMDAGNSLAPGQIQAGRPVVFRAIGLTDTNLKLPMSVAQIEAEFQSHGWRIFIERARIGGELVNPTDDTMLDTGTHVVIGGRSEMVVGMGEYAGAEIVDPELLNFGAERTPVTVSAKGAAGKTFGEVCEAPYMERVAVAKLKRNGLSIPARTTAELHPGDVLTLVGWPRDVQTAADNIGYADRQTTVSDMVFLGLGIAAGCIIGSLTVKIKGIPMGLGVSVGTLIAGLVLGWARNRRPEFGRIPPAAVWLLNNLGINLFIAIIGITAGANFMHGLHEAGVVLFLVGLVCTLLTLTLSLLLARKVFKFSTPETLGCVAGGRCAVAAIGAIEDTLQSDVPNLGYTVTYAVANIALVFSSLLVLFLV
ncbi:MAG: aspartate-alanine antiporter [Duncaniella sp.]|nr:aspartate-alanine antiporter [Duncaniella sp.]